MNISRLFSNMLTVAPFKPDTLLAMIMSKDCSEWLCSLKSQCIYCFQAHQTSAKTMFLQSLMTKLSNSYFVDGSNTTKAGLSL